jgi:uncharacterized protein
MTDLIAALRAEVRTDFGGEDPGHDLTHLDRVCGLALKLSEDEGGDSLVIAGASYVHDYHRVIERRQEASRAAVDRVIVEDHVVAALDAAGFPSNLVARVCDCVAFTDRYSFSGHVLEAPSIEAAIVRDADNLDALGAIGVARAFIFGGSLGEPIWAEGDPKEVYEAGQTTSIVHHFQEKLLKLKDDMLTVAGCKLAAKRHDFMVAFLDELMGEWAVSGRARAEVLGPG